MFEGLRLVSFHYAEARAVTDQIPEQTLVITHSEIEAKYPDEWRTLIGA
jgi:hypothetical protein